MKVRVIGTSFAKYVTNYLMLPSHVSKIALIQNYGDDKYLVVNNDDKNETLITFATEVTRRQNIEAWETIGLIDFKLGKGTLLLEERSESALFKQAKEALLEESADEKIQSLRNMRLVCVLNIIDPLSDNDIKTMHISQHQGILNVNKINRETSQFEMALAKDENWTAKVRKVINDKINR